MAYSPFTRFVMGGTTDPGTGVYEEIWACAISLVQFDGGSGPLLNPATYLTEVQAAVKSWYTSANAQNSSLSKLTYLKANSIGADGKYSDPTTSHTYDYSTPGVGANSPAAPSICSVCLSWTTTHLRGPGAHGRIYPPNNGAATVGSMKVGSSDQANLLTAAGVLLTALLNSGGTQKALPVVASNKNATNTPITGIRIGSIIDVQRRRKSEIKEIYVAATFP